MCPNKKAKPKSLNFIPPGPFSPANIPSSRKTSNIGTPTRLVITLAIMQRKAKKAEPKMY